MALSAAEIAFRPRIIGGSDANTLMSGSSERVLALYMQKRGLAEPEDLSDVLPVQLGSYSEPFNILWFEKQTGRTVTHQGDRRLSLSIPYMACTLDGITDFGDTVFEAKHVSAFAKSDEIRTRYYPQLQHNMIVCGLSRSVLSVLYGNHKWECYEIAADKTYQNELIKIEANFWDCVQNGIPPIAQQVSVPVEATKIVDMTGNNTWAFHAKGWLNNRLAAKSFDKDTKAIKELIEPDVSEAFGYGIKITRSKNGALTIKEL